MRHLSAYKKYLHYLGKYASSKKIGNLIRNKFELSQRKVKLDSLPYHVTIDPGNFCNLRCPGCHTGIKHPGMIGPSFMKLDDYKTIFSQFRDTSFSVALYNWGEPFLNKQIFDMIAHSSEYAVGTTVHSNFNVFNEKMAEDAVRSGLTHIYLSIDGASQDAYSKYRVRGHIDDVMDNLKLMTETKKRLKSKFPILTWKFLVFEHNRHEVEAARQMAAEAGVDAFEVFDATPVLTDINDQAKAFLESGESHSKKAVCRSLWSGIYVGPQGDVLPCSLAFRAEESFGNLLNQELSEVWNNSKYVNARRMFSEIVTEDIIPIPCRACKYKTICERSGFIRPAELQNKEYQN